MLIYKNTQEQFLITVSLYFHRLCLKKCTFSDDGDWLQRSGSDVRAGGGPRHHGTNPRRRIRNHRFQQEQILSSAGLHFTLNAQIMSYIVGKAVSTLYLAASRMQPSRHSISVQKI